MVDSHSQLAWHGLFVQTIFVRAGFDVDDDEPDAVGERGEKNEIYLVWLFLYLYISIIIFVLFL